MTNEKRICQSELLKNIRREQFDRTVNARCAKLLRQALELAKRQREKRS